MENATPKRRGRPPVPMKLKIPRLDPKPADSDESAPWTPEPTEQAAQSGGNRQEMRNPMRTDMRKEDSRAAAARRTAEILGHIGTDNFNEGTDEFYAPPPPPGWTYEWKTKSVLNQEQYSYQSGLKRTGWEEVPTARHPDMMPGQGNWPVIERKGMVLMQRPTAITGKVREAEERKARQQMQAKKQQLGERRPGEFGADDPRVAPKIKNSYEPISVPDDN